MILCPKPYRNEPGYASTTNKRDIDGHNQAIRRGAARWAMTEMLRRPPVGFEDVVRQHFRIRGRKFWLNWKHGQQRRATNDEGGTI
ncbi:hypothetical protein DFJ77DRAFT_449580 [Powellomyces hirtus]|nr:hypothetical protein DFJ77DRAFT_449580 [Powellomyces hirtus]